VQQVAADKDRARQVLGKASTFFFELPSVTSQRALSKTRTPAGSERRATLPPTKLDVGG
jgi:hypothetical protein